MKVLVLRFSAMGDVAMTLPVIHQVLNAHEELEITLVSHSRFYPFFKGISRLEFYGKDTQNLKGLPALYQFSKTLREKGPYASVIDLHGSLRTRILSFFLGMKGIPIYRIQKGKREKEKAIQKRNKILVPLKSTMNRYLDVFLRANLDRDPNLIPDQEVIRVDKGWKGIRSSAVWKKKDEFQSFIRNNHPLDQAILIGWAPFAGFKLKEMPIPRQVDCINRLLKKVPQAFMFLIASPKEKEALSPFFENKEALHRILFSGDWTSGLEEEFALIQELDLLVSMDSGNMHLGALLGIKVLGIYGTTHPYLGFFPYLQRQSGTLGLESLSCRPCTVFGDGNCYRGDFACMNLLDEQDLIQRILHSLPTF